MQSAEEAKNNLLQLESIIGITCSSPSGLLDIGNNTILYPAGATVVFYNYDTNCQSKHLTATIAPKPISCLAKSSENRYLAIGESGHQPRVLIYDLENSLYISSLSGHKFGVASVKFSPNSLFLVSIGYRHDGFIYLWDWKSGVKLGGIKLAYSLYALAFDATSSFFVTGGEKHIQFWDLKQVATLQLQGDFGERVIKTLEGKSGALADHKDATIVDLACGNAANGASYTYAITSGGVLLLFNEAGVLEKWLHTKMEKGSCIIATTKYIICGGSEGKIRFFEPVSLVHLGNIMCPEPLLASSSSSNLEASSTRTLYPQVVAIQLTISNDFISLYSNCNLVIFNIEKLKQVRVKRSISYHSDCVWGVKPFTTLPDPNSSIEVEGFISHSSDGSVRFWNCEGFQCKPEKNLSLMFFSTLLADPKGALQFQYQNRFGSSNDIKSVTERTGIRSLAIDPEKRIIACGDRNGSILIFKFDTFEKLATIDAHDAEIVVLEFAIIEESRKLILASASRDSLLHIFEATLTEEGSFSFNLLQTLNDHASTLTSMLFADSGKKLISCGADKAIIFRSLNYEDGKIYYKSYTSNILRSTVYDMSLSQSSRLIFTASQDRRLTIVDLDSGKIVSSFASSIISQDPTIKANPFLNTLTTDSSGIIILTGASDKSVHLLDSRTGQPQYHGIGLGDLITDVSFINLGRNFISTCADGCLFIWKTPETILKKMAGPHRISTSTLPINSNPISSLSPLTPGPVFLYDEHHLPGWARTTETSESQNLKMPAAQGMWAERVERGHGVKLFSELEEKSIAIPGERRKYSFEGMANNTSTANISIHDVDQSGLSSIESSEIVLAADPFADSLETDDSEGDGRQPAITTTRPPITEAPASEASMIDTSKGVENEFTSTEFLHLEYLLSKAVTVILKEKVTSNKVATLIRESYNAITPEVKRDREMLREIYEIVKFSGGKVEEDVL